MSRRVLLVDSDVDALGALASALRAMGLVVANANDADSAVEQAYGSRPDVVLAARDPERGGKVRDVFRDKGDLAEIPILLLVDNPGEGDLAPHEVLRADIDQIVSRITEVSRRVSRPPLPQDIRGDLEQVSLVDMLQLLAMNRRTGALSITTAHGSGEVRLAEGQVVDAVYRRLTGERALYRLLAERQGRFAFSPGDPPTLRRIQASTNMLLMEAMRQVDEQTARRTSLAPEHEVFVLSDQATLAGLIEGPESVASPTSLSGKMQALLRQPRSIDELLDEVDGPDLEILEALGELKKSGAVKMIPLATLTTPLAPPEQIPVLRSLATRLVRPGFLPPPRLTFATAPQRLSVLAYSLRRITDVVVAPEPPAGAPLPRTLGTLKLGEGVEVAVIGLPTDETYAPTWALSLPGTAAVIRVGDAPRAELEAHCEAVEVMLLDADALIGAFDPTIPAELAALLRAALEAAAGAG
jgi:CheY-like chemotaxis protein